MVDKLWTTRGIKCVRFIPGFVFGATKTQFVHASTSMLPSLYSDFSSAQTAGSEKLFAGFTHFPPTLLLLRLFSYKQLIMVG